ncbi:MAG TPA: hypothetical protein VL485_31400 [Ktedonobacteraceae bacterium]|jgi:hypothetical protein|nr:hypothetical protein [Ktedonobacteraceae bacterium]
MESKREIFSRTPEKSSDRNNDFLQIKTKESKKKVKFDDKVKTREITFEKGSYDKLSRIERITPYTEAYANEMKKELAKYSNKRREEYEEDQKDK